MDRKSRLAAKHADHPARDLGQALARYLLHTSGAVQSAVLGSYRTYRYHVQKLGEAHGEVVEMLAQKAPPHPPK